MILYIVFYILLDYNIEPQLNKYKTWIGKSQEEEINDILEIIKQHNYDEIIPLNI